MWNEVILNVLKFKWFIVSETVCGMVFAMAFWVTLKNFCWTMPKIRIFGVFFALGRRERTMVALLASRYIFILSNLIFCVNLEWIHFIALEIFVIWFNAVKLDPLALLTDTIISSVTFGAMVTENILYQYLQQVHFDWQVLMIMVMLGLFIILYSTYATIDSLQKILEYERVEKTKKKGRRLPYGKKQGKPA